jgi:outer membrane protein assembly factor BamB
VDETQLLALKVADGSLAWQSPLATGVETSCTGCIHLVDGRVVILNKDGSLQAFAPATGELMWSQALNSSPRQLWLAAGKLAVLDEDSARQNVLLLFDPQTGQPLPPPALGCAAPTAGQKNSPRLEQVYFSPDELLAYRMYASFGFDQPACADQVDLASGLLKWVMHPAKDQVWPSAWFASEVQVTEQGVFFYEDNVLSLIDASTGQMKTLFKEPRYREVTPLVSQAGLVVVLAIPDYDSNLKELWGIELSGGKKIWVYKMQAKSIIDPWRVRLTPGGLLVVQCLRDAKLSQWDRLDPLTGASLGARTLTDRNYYFLEDTWTPTTAYLKIDATLFAVDIQSGATQFTWP